MTSNILPLKLSTKSILKAELIFDPYEFSSYKFKMNPKKTKSDSKIFNFFQKFLPKRGSSSSLNPDLENATADPKELSNYGHEQVQLGRTTRKVWHLYNISNRRNLEEFVASNSFYVDVGNEEDKIQLRFYLEPIHARTASYNWDNRINKLLSVSVAVVTGGEGKKLGFSVKIDLLAESLRCEQTLLEGKRLMFNSEEAKEGKNIQTGFLCFASSRRLSSGNEYDEVYRFESQFQLVLGFTVTRLY
ncbi:unnamed protein product [Orchesella dallaii]|uniref:Uncharacterized protein n=1 Tax=Orchesella dallaii TaxID=48710 RepID=A0ABP1QCY8_9HEXA